MFEDPLRLAVVVGSNREGRFGGVVAEGYGGFSGGRRAVRRADAVAAAAV